MKTTRLLLLAAASLTLAACGSTPQRPASAQADMHNAENALDYLGTYEGKIGRAHV